MEKGGGRGRRERGEVWGGEGGGGGVGKGIVVLCMYMSSWVYACGMACVVRVTRQPCMPIKIR